MSVAIVTGASVGIGRACALGLAEDGFDVAFTYRAREPEARAVADAIRDRGRTAIPCRLDLLAPTEAVEATAARLIERAGTPDLLVNNAGVSPRVAFLDESVDRLERTLRLNLTMPFLLGQLVAQTMIAAGRPGRIVNVTSVLAALPLEACGAYCASKAALAMITRVQALELVGHGILVNAVAPGHTATPMNYGDDAHAAEGRSWRAIPLRRPARPEEVAAAVRFLASGRAGYLTGTTITVDGGLSLPNGPGALQAEMGLPPAPASLA